MQYSHTILGLSNSLILLGSSHQIPFSSRKLWDAHSVIYTVMQIERFCSEKNIKTIIENLRQLSTNAKFKREDAASGCQPCYTAGFPRQGGKAHTKCSGE